MIAAKSTSKNLPEALTGQKETEEGWVAGV